MAIGKEINELSTDPRGCRMALMTKKNSTIIMLFVGAFIGLLVTLHLKSDFVVESDFPVDEIEARDSLFKSLRDEQAYLQSKIVSLRKQIEEAQELVVLQTETVNLERLGELKKTLGLTEVTGHGIEILIDDSPFALREGSEVSDAKLVQASDLRDVVNLLNASDVEAISINGQRIISLSPISSVGTTILINNSYVAPPFTVIAIGDTEFLVQRLLDPDVLNEIYERKNKNNLVFEIAIKNNVGIPIFNGNLKTDYINLVE